MAIPARRFGQVGRSNIITIRTPNLGKPTMRKIAAEFIRRIKKGEAGWPVDTGASRARFYQINIRDNGFEVRNKMVYAKYIEAKRQIIAKFARRIMARLILKHKLKSSIIGRAALAVVDKARRDVRREKALNSARERSRKRAEARYGGRYRGRRFTPDGELE